MPSSHQKTDIEDDNCATRLRLLADPTRLKIINALRELPLTVTELLGKIPIPQNLLSHHLKVLREGTIVRSEREGKAVRYYLNASSLADEGRSIELGCCQVKFVEGE